MFTPRTGEDGGRVPPSLRRARTYAVALGALLSISGCVVETAAEQEARINGAGDKVGGAVVKANKTQIKAGETVTLDVSGSKLDGSKACPEQVLVFADDELGRDADIPYPKVQDCALAAGTTVDVTLPAGAPGIRTQTVRVAVTGVLPDTYQDVVSEATVDIKVETPLPAPNRLTTAPAPNPAPTPSPAPTPAPGSPHEPNAHFVVNPWQPVTDAPVQLNGTMSSDPDGTIAEYHWELDGDGKFDDSTGPVASVTPHGGPLEIGLRVVDDGGHTHERLFDIGAFLLPAGSLVAEPLTQLNAAKADFSTVEFRAANIPGVDRVGIDPDQDGTPLYTVDATLNPADTRLGTSFDTAGKRELDFIYYDDDAGESSTWTMIVDVAAARRSGDPTRIAYAGKTFKAIKTTATMKLKAKMLKMGKASRTAEGLHVKGLIVRGTIDGKLPKAATKVTPAQLKGLYKSEYVGSFTGDRVRLTPDAWTMKGKGTILARPRNDKKTLVCLSMSADGTLNPAGSTWKVIGASGKARGFTAKGTFTPALVGMDLPAAANKPTTLDVKAGGGKPLTKACKALAAQFPGAKRK